VPPPTPESKKDLAQRIADEKQLRQSTQQQIQILALQFQATRCNQDDVLAGNDDPNLPLVTCSQDGKEVYLLDKSIISGEQIANASSGLDQQRGEYVVDVTFKSDASKIWADFTAANVGTQTAFVLDSKVVSAPAIQEAIPGGRTQITGRFTQESAKELANVLKYGSLPLSFESSEAETVSATLGLSSLRAGLIAGAIGLALVLAYSLLYYRVLGVLTALSLVASGAMVFAILVLLGRYINYTLDLAGIAGLIIGIGTTADSFVVFFERIKDEIREGRSFRSAVPQDDPVRQRGHLPGRSGALFPCDRSGQGLRVHVGPHHDPRHCGGVPGDVAAGLSGLEVDDAGQACVQRARRGATNRARATSRRPRDGTGIAR
jgi:preprotein translocase subunit SecD